MEVLKQDRGTGKTSKLVKWLMDGKYLDDGTWSRLLICPTLMQANHIRLRFESIPKGAVLSIMQYMTIRVWHHDVTIAVDELDEVLRYVLHANVDIATLTSHPHRMEYDEQLRNL